jgi:DNA-binding CsgD family transcriptional regulator
MATAQRAADPIAIVEAAYTWEPDETRWLDAIARTAAGYDVGGGVVAWTVTFDASSPVRLRATAQTPNVQPRTVEAIARVVTRFPSELARQTFAPTEFAGNAAHRLLRLARETSGATARLARASSAQLPTWAVIGGNPTAALVLHFPGATGTTSPDARFPHARARALGLVGAHLGAALRLRTLAQPAADDAVTEAVLTPRGKVLHATGDAATPRGRASLAQTVLGAARVRGLARRAAPDEALREWTALVHGRWTIVETVERDGKRLVLARRNRLNTTGLLDLTDDERDVVWLAAHGHSYKYIAYELGQPLSTVSGRLGRAMRKLRVTSRAQLLARLGIPT